MKRIDSNKDKITAKNLFGAINDTFNNGNVKEEEKENKSTENDNEEYIDTGVPNRIKEDSVHHSNNGINQASILNSSSVSDTSKSSGIKNIIKENNMKKTENFQFPSAIKFSMIAHPFGAFALIGRDKNLRRAFPDEGLSDRWLPEVLPLYT